MAHRASLGNAHAFNLRGAAVARAKHQLVAALVLGPHGHAAGEGIANDGGAGRTGGDVVLQNSQEQGAVQQRVLRQLGVLLQKVLEGVVVGEEDGVVVGRDLREEGRTDRGLVPSRLQRVVNDSVALVVEVINRLLQVTETVAVVGARGSRAAARSGNNACRAIESERRVEAG